MPFYSQSFNLKYSSKKELDDLDKLKEINKTASFMKYLAMNYKRDYQLKNLSPSLLNSAVSLLKSFNCDKLKYPEVEINLCEIEKEIEKIELIQKSYDEISKEYKLNNFNVDKIFSPYSKALTALRIGDSYKKYSQFQNAMNKYIECAQILEDIGIDKNIKLHREVLKDIILVDNIMMGKKIDIDYNKYLDSIDERLTLNKIIEFQNKPDFKSISDNEKIKDNRFNNLTKQTENSDFETSLVDELTNNNLERIEESHLEYESYKSESTHEESIESINSNYLDLSNEIFISSSISQNNQNEKYEAGIEIGTRPHYTSIDANIKEMPNENKIYSSFEVNLTNARLAKFKDKSEIQLQLNPEMMPNNVINISEESNNFFNSSIVYELTGNKLERIEESHLEESHLELDIYENKLIHDESFKPINSNYLDSSNEILGPSSPIQNNQSEKYEAGIEIETRPNYTSIKNDANEIINQNKNDALESMVAKNHNKNDSAIHISTNPNKTLENIEEKKSLQDNNSPRKRGSRGGKNRKSKNTNNEKNQPSNIVQNAISDQLQEEERVALM